MRILLADDHGLFVEGLQNLLHAGGHLVVGTARDGLEALDQARAGVPRSTFLRRLLKEHIEKGQS